MASAPQKPQLPPLYNDLVVLSSEQHANYKMRPSQKAPFMSSTHILPLTVEEFPLVQRKMPIVFTQGDDPVPLALMGLNEGVNVFFDDEGALLENDLYIPAYLRRYPFLLVPLQEGSTDLSLCFDPTADTIGDFAEGDALFDAEGKPSQVAEAVLAFNEQFEQSAHNSAMFMKELKELDLLRDEEAKIELPGAPQPFIYRGFQVVDEEKLRNLRGDQLRKMVQNGMLPLIYCHLYSLNMIREVFDRQLRQNRVPGVTFTPPEEGDPVVTGSTGEVTTSANQE